MGKRKRIKNSRREFCVEIFIQVFSHIISLHKEREKFSFTWIWNDPSVLKLFAEVVLGRCNASRDILRNGYRICRSDEYSAFPSETWAKIDEVFLHKRLLSDMPKPVRDLLKVLKANNQSQLGSLVQDKEDKVGFTTTNSNTWIGVSKVSTSSLESMRGCFLGEWTIPANKIFQPELAQMCRAFPPECILAQNRGNLTYFYERDGSNVDVIAVHLKGALEFSAMGYMRSLMEDLFAGHPKIVRRSMATLQSHMTGFGPFWQRFELRGGSKVSFYTHLEKLGNVLKNLPTAREFEALVDRYAHRHLTELILAMYMWKLPALVSSFLKFSKPYLNQEDYDMSELEMALGNYGPCAYQLYITKDFCSSIHKDIDISKFTLSYCSHPDNASSTPVQFVMAEHGFRIGVEDGSLFAFKSSVNHGTAYRNHTPNAAYMGCVVVNSALHALTRRRQLL